MHRNLTLGALGLAAASAAILAPQALAWPASATCTGIELHEDGTHSYVVKAGSTELARGTYTDESGVIPIQVPDGVTKVRVVYDGKTAEDYPVKGAPCVAPPPPPPPPLNPPVGPPGPVPPPENVTPPPPAADCAYLVSVGAGKRRLREAGCIPERTTPPPPPRKRSKVCAKPAKLRIIQQQRGTFYTQTYPLRVIIGARANYRQRGVLTVWDQGLQNYVGPDGKRVERLVIPIRPMARGEVLRVDRTMGYTGPAAFKTVIRTFAKLTVGGRPCGHTYDDHFEG